jgi:uncharacterized protein (DUF362 family)/Ni,Fe-hydrogenase III small subunit
MTGTRLDLSAPGPLVNVAHGRGAYENTRRALQAVDLSAASGRQVLLKPNVGRVAPVGSGVNTHPDVVAAAIDALREAGAVVSIGESPIAGVDVGEAFAAAGVTRVASERDCPLIDMDRRRFAKRSLPEGRAIHSLRVCPEVVEADLVVSIPVMKMHMHTAVTLSVKNMKGCLWRRSKVQLHMLPPVEGSLDKPIDVAIADMSSVLRPDLAIIDGTVGMEGLGPSAGQAKPLDVVVVGTDPFAADAVACQLMGTSAQRVPHLRIGASRGYGVIDLDRLCVTADNWRDFASPFDPPPEKLTIEFPNVSILDENSCSACQSTVLMFLQRNRERIFDYFPDASKINIAIGKGHCDLPAGTLCIGNCTISQRGKGVFVPGCPPVASQILRAISEQAAAEGQTGARETSEATQDEALEG